MDYYFWVSTRSIKPDTREQFEQSWRPAEPPDGLVGAYVLYAEQGDEVVGISIWDSAEACDRYRRSDIEARRQEATPPGGGNPSDGGNPPDGSDPDIASVARGAIYWP